MCYSFSASLSMWAAMMVISIFLYNRNRRYDRWNAGFIFILSLVQLIEAGMWTGIKNLSNILLIAIMLQPLAQCYLGLRYNRNSLILIILTLFCIMGILWAILIPKIKPISEGKDGHLEWEIEFPYGVFCLYIVGIFVPVLYMNIRSAAILIIGMILSAVIAISQSTGNSFSSIWCFYSIIYAVAAMIA